MKKHAILFIILFALFISIPSFSTTTNYFVYDNYGGNWSDADKTKINTEDDLMCWAAAVSNILSWAGWSASYSNADAIFAAFQYYWTDQGSLMSYGWDWWLNGTLPYYGTTSSYVDVSGGGNYYSYILFANYYHEETNDSQVMSAIADYLTNGYGTTIGIYSVTIAHALTVWGYSYDENGTYTGIWVTDSDDYGTSDLLQYYNVVYKNGKWYLQNYYGYNDIYIGLVEALERNSTASSVPVPATSWLMGSGLLGLIWIRRKLGKH
ncbi:MAG: PEP-CTERM sorting domain-containing protein [Smithella sp.]